MKNIEKKSTKSKRIHINYLGKDKGRSFLALEWKNLGFFDRVKLAVAIINGKGNVKIKKIPVSTIYEKTNNG